MNVFETLFDLPLIHCLGWTLVHFLWQGATVGVLYAGLRQVLQGKSPATRYYLAMGTLAVMTAIPVVTFLHLWHSATTNPTPLASHAMDQLAIVSGYTDASSPLILFDRFRLWLQPLVPWAVPLWLLGVLVASMRVLRGWRRTYQLRTTAEFMPLQPWYVVVESLRARFGMTRFVRLAISARLSVPSVIGWLKPIILIPPSVMAGLTPLQMELILAHELAHIRRHDYVWNLLQVLVETLLFYHPAVRWVSGQARIEREQCCDDMVVELQGNTVEYARALTELESLRQPVNALLLGANGGQVLNRIHRLLGQSAQEVPVHGLPMLALVGLLFAASVTQFAHQMGLANALLATQYTLMANVQPQALPKSLPHDGSIITPIRMPAIPSPQPATLRPIPVEDRTRSLEFADMPDLAAPRHPAATPINQDLPDTQHVAEAALITGSIIEKHMPVYPALALERGIEGSATVEFDLSAEGVIQNMRVIKVVGSRLFGLAALDALQQWKIMPTTKAGMPVEQRMVQEFIFRLKEKSGYGGVCKIPMGYHVCSTN